MNEFIDFLTARLDGADMAAASITMVMGTVRQASPLLVQLDTDATAAGLAARRISGAYSATLNDRVLVIVLGGVDRVVLGKPV